MAESAAASTSGDTSQAEIATSCCDMQRCQGCSFTNKQFYPMLDSEDSLWNFLVHHGVVPCHRRCPKCRRLLDRAVHGGRYVFRCQSTNKKSGRKCNVFMSALRDTFLYNIKPSLANVIEIVHLYLTRPPPRGKYISLETGVSFGTVMDYFSFIREVLIFWAVRNSEEIGGEGKIVEVLEAKIEERKYNRARLLEGQWLLGAIERDTKRFLLVAMEDRTSSSILGIIKDAVRPGTTICSKAWRAHDHLTDEDFEDLRTNYSIHYNPQESERSWSEVQRFVPRFGRRYQHYEGYLAECLFIKAYRDHRQRLHVFWTLAGELYPGQQ